MPRPLTQSEKNRESRRKRAADAAASAASSASAPKRARRSSSGKTPSYNEHDEEEDEDGDDENEANDKSNNNNNDGPDDDDDDDAADAAEAEAEAGPSTMAPPPRAPAPAPAASAYAPQKRPRPVPVNQQRPGRLSVSTVTTAVSPQSAYAKNPSGAPASPTKPAAPSPVRRRQSSASPPVVIKKRPSLSQTPSDQARSSPSTSTNKAKASSSGNSSGGKTEDDSTRRAARANFKTALESLMSDVQTNPGSPLAVSPGEEATMSVISMEALSQPIEARAEAYSNELEAALWEKLAEPDPKGRNGAKKAGKAYRDRFRTILLALKDKSNARLRTRIALGSLQAGALALMQGQELANDEIRSKNERAMRESMEQSVITRTSNAPLRRMTHKGEEPIEVEVGNQLHTRDEQALREEEYRRRREEEREIADELEIRDNLAAQRKASGHFVPESPEDERGSPLAAAAVVAGPTRVSVSGQSTRLEGNDRAGSPAAPSAGFNFQNIFGVGERDDSADISAEVVGDTGSAEDAAHEGDNTRDGEQDWRIGVSVDADDIMDALDGPSAKRASAEPAPAPAPAPVETPASPTSEPLLTDKPIWRGAITMPEEATFSGTVRQVAGRAIGDDPHTISHFFPVPHATMEGRLPSEKATEYLEQCNLASRIELAVFALEPTLELSALAVAGDDAPLTVQSNETAFARFLQYLVGRERYGVLPYSPFAKGIIKDFYIAGLPNSSDPPEWLQQLSPSRLRPTNERGDLLLIVAVLNRSAFEADLDDTKRRRDAEEELEAKRRADEQELASSAAQQQQQENGLPKAGALQDLLSSLGGNATADKSIPNAAQSNGDWHMDQVPAPAEGNSLAAPTAAALKNIPEGELEGFLMANPELVKQLLNSIQEKGIGGSTGGNSSSRPQPQPPAYPTTTQQPYPPQMAPHGAWGPGAGGWGPPPQYGGYGNGGPGWPMYAAAGPPAGPMYQGWPGPNPAFPPGHHAHQQHHHQQQHQYQFQQQQQQHHHASQGAHAPPYPGQPPMPPPGFHPGAPPQMHPHQQQQQQQRNGPSSNGSQGRR